MKKIEGNEIGRRDSWDMVEIWDKRHYQKIYVVKDRSTQLVGIVDTLGDPPFGLVHRLSIFCLQHSHVLRHWAIECCLAELLGDAPIAPFHHRLDLLPQGSRH
ncbi:hypothetical protein H5410_005172 [Solanum commersonii]|uniref:Uncharacterized protein n=1 Tax=Solanum commersonii TaxID=4109 RepID=A0A9J6A6F8_SOLCO|nr:hypothetical protein H5410_005172 [Solanum commersonii]